MYFIPVLELSGSVKGDKMENSSNSSYFRKKWIDKINSEILVLLLHWFSSQSLYYIHQHQQLACRRHSTRGVTEQKLQSCLVKEWEISVSCNIWYESFINIWPDLFLKFYKHCVFEINIFASILQSFVVCILYFSCNFHIPQI